jgi:SAM-dependent methyltransferase
MGRRNNVAIEKEELISQIEGRAFRPIIPFSPKPWMELGVSEGRLARALRIPQGMDIDKGSLRVARQRGIKVMPGKEGVIPILSEKVGSLFLIMSPCPPPYLKKLLQECHRVLKREGKILIGFIPRNSPWGKFYQAQKKRGLPSYRGVRLHSVKEMEYRIMQAGFSIQGLFCTLFQRPGELKDLENPLIGYRPQAGFLVLVGERMR